MEKYYFNTMLNGDGYNWIEYGYASSYTEEEIKKGKIVIGNEEYDLIPLSKVPEYLKNHPECKLYKSTVEELDEESQKFLLENIKHFAYTVEEIKNANK